jgi:GNAT superfamily N-acetyltransferase
MCQWAARVRALAQTRRARYAEHVTTQPAQRIAGTDFELRPIRAEDWELAKCVRLAALADAPDAFGATLAGELELSESDWRARARGNAQGLSSRGFLAQRQDVPCGLAVGVLNIAAHSVILNGMWVAENVRRRGIARALVAAVCDWARERGAREVELQVTLSSSAARGLYVSLGFEESGRAEITCGERQSPALRMRLALGK